MFKADLVNLNPHQIVKNGFHLETTFRDICPSILTNQQDLSRCFIQIVLIVPISAMEIIFQHYNEIGHPLAK